MVSKDFSLNIWGNKPDQGKQLDSPHLGQLAGSLSLFFQPSGSFKMFSVENLAIVSAQEIHSLEVTVHSYLLHFSAGYLQISWGVLQNAKNKWKKHR